MLQSVSVGGISLVYKALDTRAGNRPVAVKVMNQDGLSAQELQQATDHIKLVAGLVHPNLPRIYEHFSLAGHSYLIMDFLEGATLQELLKTQGGPLGIEQTLQIGIQLCAILEYLHTHQPPFLLCDLNPQQVMLTPDNHISIIDFGISRLFKQGWERYGPASGAARYFAPEVALKAQRSPQADVFSLGALLHLMVTGNPAGDAILEFEPMAPSISASLAALIRQMVDINAAKRPSDLVAVQKQLDDLREDFVMRRKSGASLSQPGVLLLDHHQQDVQAVAWSLDGSALASGSADNTVHIYDATTRTLTAVQQNHKATVFALNWAPNGQFLASGSQDATVQIFDKTSRQTIYTYQGHRGYTVFALAWAPDGRRLASGGQDTTVQVWEPATGKLLGAYKGHTDTIGALSWSPDGQRLASGGYERDKTVQIWSATTRKNLLTYRGHANAIYAIAWSPDGKWIASAGDDMTVQIWEATGGRQPLLIYRGHRNFVKAVAWSPDGNLIASGSWDETVQVWDAFTGNLRFTFNGHQSRVKALAWSPDGKQLISGSADGKVLLWSVTLP